MTHPNTPEAVASRKQRFLHELSRRLNVKQSALAIGIDVSTVYDWKKRDPEFRARFDELRTMGREQAGDSLLDTAIAIAEAGNPELLKFLLKGLRPDLFHERLQIAQHTQQRIIIQVDDSALQGLPPALPASALDAEDAQIRVPVAAPAPGVYGPTGQIPGVQLPTWPLGALPSENGMLTRRAYQQHLLAATPAGDVTPDDDDAGSAPHD